MDQNILIVDNDKEILETLEDYLSHEGYIIVTTMSYEAALQLIQKKSYNILLLDLNLVSESDEMGFKLLEKVRALSPLTETVVITAYSSSQRAVKAIKLGAYDFIDKGPNLLPKISVTLRNLVERQRGGYDYLIGESPSIIKVHSTIKKVSDYDETVLITGETGVGKEVVARTIHMQSKRNEGPFIAVNCAAIPDTLLESELFGHEKGSFTGAHMKKIGKFECANGGTLFLDEIGDMSVTLQPKLLRVLQERTIQRVGGNDNISVDVRIVSATRRNLEEEMKNGGFREDLYYRLKNIPIHVPALRERKEDIPAFIEYFCKRHSAKYKEQAKTFSKDCVELFMGYQWPGNIRELENTVGRAIIMSAREEITPNDIQDELLSLLTQGPIITGDKSNGNHIDTSENYTAAMERFEKEYLIEMLKKNGGNVTRTAKSINIHRVTLERKIKKLGINSG